jgi:hypothetical protein
LTKIAECQPHLLVIGLRLGAADCVEFVKALKVQTPTRVADSEKRPTSE